MSICADKETGIMYDKVFNGTTIIHTTVLLSLALYDAGAALVAISSYSIAFAAVAYVRLHKKRVARRDGRK